MRVAGMTVEAWNKAFFIAVVAVVTIFTAEMALLVEMAFTPWMAFAALGPLAGYWAWRRAGRKNAAKRLARREAGERIVARILGKS